MPNDTSNCVNCQAFSAFITFIFSFRGVPDLTMAFRMVSSLRMHATKATFFYFPDSQEPLIELANGGAKASGRQCCHIECSTQCGSTTADAASAFEAA